MKRWIVWLICLGAGALVLLMVGLCALLLSAGNTEEKQPATKATYSQSFMKEPEDKLRYSFIGRNAANHITFEPEGLRIKLPPGHPDQRPSTGLAMVSTVRGNFEITARFELLKEPEPEEAGKFATRLTMGVLLDTPERNEVAISRRMIAKGRTQFFTFWLMEQGAKGKVQPKLQTLPTEARSGRLRLVRTGAVISCFAAEGVNEDFLLVEEYPFSPQDVKQVFFHTSTGGPDASLDMRISDLHIIADALPDLDGTRPPPPGSKKWLVAALIVNFLLLLAAVGGACVLYLLKRRKAH